MRPGASFHSWSDQSGIAPEILIDLHGALEKLAQSDVRKAQVLELRYFGALTGDQAAAVLGLSASSVDRQWVYTRAWLRRELGFGVES